MKNDQTSSRFRTFARQSQQSLDLLHARIHKNTWLQIFTAFTRCILAIGFIPASLPKILHKPFTSISAMDPVGAYFKALYETGYYYDFIGWCQLTASILLLLPRTAHVGALLFFPIILNITVLTNSVGFKGTWLVTIMMSIANLYLLCWEYDRIKSLFIDRRTCSSHFDKKYAWLIPAIFTLGGLGVMVMMLILGIARYDQISLRSILPLMGAGLIFGCVVYLHYRNMKVGPAKPDGIEIMD